MIAHLIYRLFSVITPPLVVLSRWLRGADWCGVRCWRQYQCTCRSMVGSVKLHRQRHSPPSDRREPNSSGRDALCVCGERPVYAEPLLFQFGSSGSSTAYQSNWRQDKYRGWYPRHPHRHFQVGRQGKLRPAKIKQTFLKPAPILGPYHSNELWLVTVQFKFLIIFGSEI